MLANGGEFQGTRILTQASIDRMTTPLSMDIMSEMGRPTGMDMGYSVFVMRDSSAEGNAAPQRHFWVVGIPQHPLLDRSQQSDVCAG